MNTNRFFRVKYGSASIDNSSLVFSSKSSSLLLFLGLWVLFPRYLSYELLIFSLQLFALGNKLVLFSFENGVSSSLELSSISFYSNFRRSPSLNSSSVLWFFLEESSLLTKGIFDSYIKIWYYFKLFNFSV